MAVVNMQATFQAPPQRVYDFFVNHDTFGKLWPVPSERIKNGEDGNPNGVGSVRSIKVGPTAIQEVLVTTQPPEGDASGLVEYKIIKGGGVKHHFGSIRILPGADGSTNVKYRIELAMIVPGLGWAALRGLQSQFYQGLERVRSEIETA